MSSIDHFESGAKRLLVYAISTPAVLVPLLWATLFLIVTLIYPATQTIYPFWKGDVDYVTLRPFAQVLDKVDVAIEAPDRLLPGSQRYALKVTFTQMTTVNSETRHVMVNLATDLPYVVFQENTSLPITIEQEVTPLGSSSTTLQFSVLGGTHPRGPVTFVVVVVSEESYYETSFRIPIDQVSVSLTAVAGLVSTVVLSIIGLLARLIIRTDKPRQPQ